MENLVCNAYAYIEYKKSFDNFYDGDRDNLSLEILKGYWRDIKKDYYALSAYMTDEAITQAQKFVIEEL